MRAHQLNARILVVEDDPTLLAVFVEALAADGYRVTTASNGRLALEQLREERYALIFCDIRMPELDGIGLYRVLEQDYPHLCPRIIFVTGYGLSPDIQAFVLETGVPILWKPFHVAEICWIARLMLGVRKG
jgi:twitching motility two-component system response regulator PilH